MRNTTRLLRSCKSIRTEKWSRRQLKKTWRSTAIPDGSAGVTESGKMYYASGGRLLRIQSEDIFRSWKFTTVFLSTDFILSGSEFGGKVGFRPGSVVGSLADHCFYYIASDGTRRKIVSPSFFKETGLSRFNTKFVSKSDLELHKIGEDIE